MTDTKLEDYHPNPDRVKEKYFETLVEYTPYVVMNRPQLKGTNAEIVDGEILEIEDSDTDLGPIYARWIDPMEDEYADTFKDAILKIDAAAYADKGEEDVDITMPGWVLTDAGFMSGGVYGFGKELDELEGGTVLDDWMKDNDLEDDRLVPLSHSSGVYQPDGTYFGHTLGAEPAHKGNGLGKMNMVLRTVLSPSKRFQGIVQLGVYTVPILTSLGEVSVEKAGIPVHDIPEESLLYTMELDTENLSAALENSAYEKPDFDIAVGPGEIDKFDEISRLLEDGKEAKIPEPGIILEDEPQIPVEIQ